MRGAYSLTDPAEVAAANRELHRGEEDAAVISSESPDASSLALLMMCKCGHELGWHTQWDECTYCHCLYFTLSPAEGGVA